MRPLPTERESGALELELSVAVRHLLGRWKLSLGPLQKHKCSDPLDHLSGPRNHILKQNIQTQEELPGCACAWLRGGTGPPAHLGEGFPRCGASMQKVAIFKSPLCKGEKEGSQSKKV